MTTPEYTLGLDIGIASVGAALLTQKNILALHVRTFDKAETAKEGDSLNKVRREARLIRRRLRRRAYRLTRLREAFARHGILPDSKIETLRNLPITSWQLRAEGLDRQLLPKEWGAVLYHLVKHRGFQSNRKSELKTDQKAGEMLNGVQKNQDVMENDGYRTVGELAARDPRFAGQKRNKEGSYTHTFDRSDLEHELAKLFERQRALGNPHTDRILEEEVHTLLMSRRAALSGEQLLEMVGTCTFEPQEKRIPKASIYFERFSLWQKLNNLKIEGPRESRPLSSEERRQCARLPFETSKLSYKQMRTALEISNDERFNLCSYRPSKNSDNEKHDPESKTFFEAKYFHQLRKAYKAAHLEKTTWQHDALDHERLHALSFALTCYKTDEDIRDYLRKEHGFETSVIEAVLPLAFDGFGRMSKKAIEKILPFLEKGQRYDEAAQSAGYHHSLINHPKRQRYLPKPAADTFRNPVVYRAINQARKMVNALIKAYGPPSAIHIELARDLSRPFNERKTIEKQQNEYRTNKEQHCEQFKENFGRTPNDGELEKYRLYKEQHGKCAYSLQSISLNRLCEPGYVEVDHILPFSRSFNDSKNNKALVLTAENRNKGNRTPFEYLGNDATSPGWKKFEAWVNSTPLPYGKKSAYLRQHLSAEESEKFKERNLNDTRYICKEFKTMLEKQLKWHESAGNSPRCVVVTGQLTALLRYHWGLIKKREESDLHHAMDAAVVAACSRSLVKRMANHAKRNELKEVRADYIDPETGEVLDIAQPRNIEKEFPTPWPHFPAELWARLSSNPCDQLKKFKNDAALANIQPVRVSRMPTRLGTGKAHKETIRSMGRGGKLIDEEQSSIKTPLSQLKLKDLENIVGAKDPRNKALIDAIKKRLEEYNDKGEKAFGKDNPLYKPAKNGKQGPLIRSVKLKAVQKNGLRVRGGIANNVDMLRVDIFSKDGSFYGVPIYVADAASKELPNRAATSKLEREWPVMDASYEFLFSLHKNDWLKVVDKKNGEKRIREGYYDGFDRSTGSINLWTHDRNQNIGKKGLIRSIGIRTVQALEKYHVDMLGRLYKASIEQRQPLPLAGKR